MTPELIKTMIDISGKTQNVSNHRSLKLLCEMQRFSQGLDVFSNATIHPFYDSRKEVIEKAYQWLSHNGYTCRVERYYESVDGYIIDGAEVKLIVSIECLSNTVRLITFGDEDLAKPVTDWFNTEFKKQGYTLSTAIRINKQDVPEFQEDFIIQNSVQKPCQSFYPWLSVSLDEYIDAFMASDENILVLFGPAGTGKSSFIRYLLDRIGKDAYLAYNKDIIASPHLLEWFHKFKAQAIAYEDIDTHLDSRENGNTLMSTILNGAEGIIKSKKKMIFSTNLPSTNRIDSALLRVGRCFDVLQFSHLTQAEAAKVRSDLGKAPKDLGSKSNWSLAEAIADTNEAQQVVNRFGRKAGF